MAYGYITILIIFKKNYLISIITGILKQTVHRKVNSRFVVLVVVLTFIMITVMSKQIC